MKKSLLLGIAGMAAVAGTANVRAACIPTQDCAELGYKYTSSECAGDRIACPFDTSKFFCFEPLLCEYTFTKADCDAECKNVGSKSCIKDSVTYYETCGTSKCGGSQVCRNGTCKMCKYSGPYYKFYCYNSCIPEIAACQNAGGCHERISDDEEHLATNYGGLFYCYTDQD